MIADAHTAEMQPVDSTAGLLGTTVRWATFLFLVDTLLAALSALSVMHGELVLGVLVGYVAASLLAVSVLYFVATNGANPGPVLKGGRAWFLQPVMLPYRTVAWFVCVAARVVRRGLVPIAEVAPGVFLGMRLFPQEVWRLEAQHIDCVVDLASELPRNARIGSGRYERLELPVLDRCAPTLKEVVHATRWIVERVDAGKRVYLHCAFGRGRSAMIAAAVLLRMGVARSAHEAVWAVKRARPLIGVKGVQYERLKEFAAWLGTRANLP